MIALIIILSLPALSPHLCDLYTDNVYGTLCDAVSHVTGLFPVALGEILMYIGVALLLAAILFLLLLVFHLFTVVQIHPDPCHNSPPG